MLRSLSFAILLIPVVLQAQSDAYRTFGQERSVAIEAVVNSHPPTIELRWAVMEGAQGHTVYRMEGIDGGSWQQLASLPGDASGYTDADVQRGRTVSYKVVREGPRMKGVGYLSTGVSLPPRERMGHILLVVDDRFSLSLAAQVERLERDLEGDGWQVHRREVSRTWDPPLVKQRIREVHDALEDGLQAILLLGNVPVPYSGDHAPDGHEEHTGAWAADVYYADMHGTWTDHAVDNPTSAYPRNRNVPGDGRFDQSTISAQVRIALGRVDMHALDSFAATEEELLAAYLDKDHAWRHGRLQVRRRALVHDGFPNFGDAFSANAWRGFPPLVHADSVQPGSYLDMATEDHLWSFGCGPGWFPRAIGVVDVADLAAKPMRTVFTMLLGSYFGDWDNPDGLLRATLASGDILTSCWAGYPNWFVHPMGIGATIGECLLITQNNTSGQFEPANPHAGGTHIALMGDPNLRMHVVVPPRAVKTSTRPRGRTIVQWEVADAGEVGSHVFRRDPGETHWTRITTEPVAGSSFTEADARAPQGRRYMVRHLAEITSPSGSFQQYSQGITAEQVPDH